MVEWHPTAENILVSAGYDHTIMVWNIARGVAVNTITCHTDTIYSMSFNRFEPNPYLFHAFCKRVDEPRSNPSTHTVTGGLDCAIYDNRINNDGDTGNLSSDRLSISFLLFHVKATRE